jgi:hypothetical protein
MFLENSLLTQKNLAAALKHAQSDYAYSLAGESVTDALKVALNKGLLSALRMKQFRNSLKQSETELLQTATI